MLRLKTISQYRIVEWRTPTHLGGTKQVHKLLIVDDDRRNLFALTAALEQEDYDILEAESGEAALKILNANPDIKCVLIDLMMPGMDGCELMRRIRASKSSSDLPAIAVTAKVMPEDERRCREAGCSGYIAKPIDTPQLLHMLETVIEERGEGRA
jgi:CheY-like chemotaxis protein